MSESSLQYCIPLGNAKPKYMTLVPTDLGSRYKTRQLQIQIQGKSKMIKTMFVNILEVAKDMQIPPAYPVMFMGYEIGAQPHFDLKKPERQQAYLSGEHEPKVLGRIVEKFIVEVLLCPSCGLPEINLSVDAKKDVVGKCRACGANPKMSINSIKFKNYVINHPPQQSGSAFSGNKSAKKPKKAKKEGDEDGSDEGSDDEGEDEAKEEDPADLEKRVKEQVQVKTAPKGKKKDAEDNIQWFSDTSEEARRKRREALLPENLVAQMSLKDKAADVKKILDQKPIDVAQLTTFKKENQINDKDFMSVLVRELFATAPFDDAAAKTHAKLLATFSKSRDAQRELLSALQSLALADPKKEVLAKLPKTLHILYEADVVDEDAIKEWHSASTTEAAVKEKAAPLVKWLDEAEEDDDEEDEE